MVLKFLFIGSMLVAVGPALAQSPPVERQSLQDRIEAQTDAMTLFMTGKGAHETSSAAHGLADVGNKRALSVDTPFRIASNTKTFVAAAVLRLWEQHRIDLDAPIAPLLTPALDALLRRDGYATDRITVRQLLSHSGGIYDLGGDKRFIATVLADPSHVWTREEQVRLSMIYGDPLSGPGTEFHYSDTGYVLMGDIVERITAQPLATAVRNLVGLDRLGLTSTWWETVEPAPTNALPRARQALDKVDATDVHPSMDLYGGGGLLMSTRDLATFFAALFEGRVFDRPETIQEMLWIGPHRGSDGYRLGVFVKKINGRELYWHSGFWGTHVYYAPDTHTAVAGMTTNQTSYRKLATIIEDVLTDGP